MASIRHRSAHTSSLILAVTLAVTACSSDGENGEDGADQAAPDDESTATEESGEWTPEWIEGVLQPLPDGFPDRPLTMIVADNLVTRDGVLAQDLANFGADLSPVPLVVEAREEYDAGWGTWEALKFAFDDADGQEGYVLTLGATPADLADLLTTDVSDELGLDHESKGEVIALEDNPYLLIQCPSAPWPEPSVEAFTEYAQANPGQVRYMGGGPGAGSDVAAAYIFDGLGLGNLYEGEFLDHRNVGNTADRATAVAACEGDLTNVSYEAAQPHIQSGRVDVIMHSGEGQVDEFPDVPSAQDVGVPGNSWSSMRTIMVPNTVDPVRIQWLYELIRGITEQADYQEKRRQAPGTIFLNWTPEEGEQFTQDFMPVLDELLRDLGIHKDQVEQ